MRNYNKLDYTLLGFGTLVVFSGSIYGVLRISAEFPGAFPWVIVPFSIMFFGVSAVLWLSDFSNKGEAK